MPPFSGGVLRIKPVCAVLSRSLAPSGHSCTWCSADRISFFVCLAFLQRIGRCHNPNLLRYPFWLRGYGLVGFHGLPQGDDLWVKLDKPHLWRRHIEYARAHPQMERTRLNAYKTLLPEMHRNALVLDKFTKKL